MAASHALDIRHTVLPVFRAEFPLCATGKTKVQLLGATVVGAPLDDSVDPPVSLLVFNAHLSLVAAGNTRLGLPGATLVPTSLALDIHHAVFLVLRAELCLFAARHT